MLKDKQQLHKICITSMTKDKTCKKKTNNPEEKWSKDRSRKSGEKEIK